MACTTDPGAHADERDPVLDLVRQAAGAYLDALPGAPLRRNDAGDATGWYAGPLPAVGAGALATVRDLIEHGLPASTGSAGPRMFHFVTGRAAEHRVLPVPTTRGAGTARLGAAVLDDGRVYVGTTRYAGCVAFRPAIVNWMTTEADVDLLVDVIRELGSGLRSG